MSWFFTDGGPSEGYPGPALVCLGLPHPCILPLPLAGKHHFLPLMSLMLNFPFLQTAKATGFFLSLLIFFALKNFCVYGHWFFSLCAHT